MKLDRALVNNCNVPIITVTNTPFHNGAWFLNVKHAAQFSIRFCFYMCLCFVVGLSPLWHVIVLFPSVFTCFVFALDYFAYLICLLIPWCDSGFLLIFFSCRLGVQKAFILLDKFETYQSCLNQSTPSTSLGTPIHLLLYAVL